MYARIGVPALGALALMSCTPHAPRPDGTVLVDDAVALIREANVDRAARKLRIDGDALIIAIVDENLTDVRVRLEVAGVDAASIRPVEVENTLGGSGIEVAALAVPAQARVTVTLSGPQNSKTPGTVQLRVLQFAPGSSPEPKLAAQRAAFTAWSGATRYGQLAPEAGKAGLAAIDRAIVALEGPQGDNRLAAEANLVKAGLLQYFLIDVRQSLDAARRAGSDFAAIGETAALGAARAQLAEATALTELAVNAQSKNPTAQEARTEAERLLAHLTGQTSPLRPIERARALDSLGYLHKSGTLLDEAAQTYEQARALYAEAGYRAGETEMQAAIAQVFVERGQWDLAAKEFARMLPNVKKIPNPIHRVKTLLSAGHALAYAGEPDEGIKLLLDAITEAREFGLRSSEGEATWELAWLYWFRGDDLQAKALFTQALKIARTLDNEYGLSSNLQTVGMVARREGDYVTAIEMHKEAIPASPTPFHRIRAIRDLALDYVAVGQYSEAIAELRNALAVKIQDPRHHIFTDIKRDLAETLIEHGDGSRASQAEAVKLLADSMQMSVKMNDARNQIAGNRVEAMMAMKQGKFAAARAGFERTFELIFKYRRASANPQLRLEALEQEQSAFRGYFDLMMRGSVANGAGAPRPASAQATAALRMLERSRETRLGKPRSVNLDAATSARVDALLAQMGDRSLKISALLGRELDATETLQLDGLQMELARLRAEVDRERTVAAERHVSHEEPAVAVARPWRDVSPRAVQLSYALGNDHAYVWIRDPGGLRVAVLRETPENIERELTKLASFDAQRMPAEIEQSLARVSSILLPAGIVPEKSSELEIVAEGRIASVPFAGLRSPADPSLLLVETHAVTLITSMYSADETSTAQARPMKLVALASGGGTLRSAPMTNPLPSLQSATAEIQGIADLFKARDRDARVKLFASNDGDARALRTLWSSGVDVVHFATHALADLRQPLASLLVLPSKDASGAQSYLTAGQVQEWRGDVGLVFLSACESAIGPPRFASGMPGLQSAFLRAGAHGVIATLWPIEDVLARDFSADFYRRFTAGETAAQALSATQRAWVAPKPGAAAAAQMRRRMTALAHEFYVQ